MDSDADSESVANHALPSITPDARPDDIFKILVATDIHLGVHEKDPIRGDVLQIIKLSYHHLHVVDESRVCPDPDYSRTICLRQPANSSHTIG